MNVTHGLRRALQVNADGLATSYEGRRRTWAEIGDRVARLAGGLRSLGVGNGDRVAVLMANADSYLELYLGVAWAGAVVVPLNNRWSVPENEAALNDSGPKVLVVDRAFQEIAARLAGMLADPPVVVYADNDDGAPPAGMRGYEALLAASEPVPDAMRAPADLAGIFYTGGTTGRAKGVMLTHANLMANARNALAEGLFGPGTVYLHAAPMFHLANGCGMYSVLLSGGSNAFVAAFSPAAVLDAIERERVTDVLLVPTMIQMLADHDDGGRRRDLTSLRRIVYGASPISEAVLDRAAARFPDVEFVQAYGQTELSPIATLLPWADHVGEARRRGRHRSAGRATLSVDVRVVDEDDRELPRGTPGQIVVRGDTVMAGYWNQPDATAAAVVDGWMHTGDAGYMAADGYVYVVDRVKDMIISGGENVYSAEVENCLAQHPAVAQCAVVGIPSERWGEQVHAFVVPKPGSPAPVPDELIAFCKERIAGYKCPLSVDVRTEPFPLSGAGKILKRELRAPYWEGRSRAVG